MKTLAQLNPPSPIQTLHPTQGQLLDQPLVLLFNCISDGNSGIFHNLFFLFYSPAKVDCKVVKGVAKTGIYVPGDLKVDEEKMRARWNKVFLMGKYWPINPRYILRSKQSKGGDTVESGLFNEFWFLTDPAVFIQHCLPKDPEDQMLPPSMRIKTEREYMKLPNLTPAFIEFGLRLTSEEQCIIEAVEGLTKVTFKAERNLTKNFDCDFSRDELRNILNLSGKTDQNITNALKGINTDQLVFCSRKKNQFMFEIRCPVEGAAYFLTTLGGILGEGKKTLSKTKIVCREKMENFKPFPENPGNIGWGFGPRAKMAGLKTTSQKEPRFILTEGRTKIKFTLDQKVDKKTGFNATLSGEGKTAEDLSGMNYSSV